MFFVSFFFFFNDTATTEIYPLSLHDALPISRDRAARRLAAGRGRLPAPDGARARRDGQDSPDADAVRGEVRDRAGGARLDDRLRRRGRNREPRLRRDRKSTRLNS